MHNKKSKKATWFEAIATFLAPVFLLLALRWIVFEPFVIPSGSMIPTLLIHDHVLVNKWVYGLRLPFSESWLVFWNKPQRGEIVVFKYPKNKDTFFIKRVVAVEGDEIEVVDGQLFVNNQPIPRQKLEDLKTNSNSISNSNSDSDSDSKSKPESKSDSNPNSNDLYTYYKETLNGFNFISRSSNEDPLPDFEKIKIPQGHFFVVGDNRDESNDSRSWGVVPNENLMWRAWLIWLSCKETLVSNPMVCDPNQIRWDRIFKPINN